MPDTTLPFSPRNAALRRASDGDTVAVALPHGLSKSDVAALCALMLDLEAGWHCAAGRNDAGHVWATISRGDGEGLRAYSVTRDGPTLDLEDLCAPFGPALVGTFDSFENLTAALGGEIGWRHVAVG